MVIIGFYKWVLQMVQEILDYVCGVFWRARGNYFGLGIPDWYHLQNKMRELCSMVAFGKTHKDEILAVISPLLW